MATEAPTPGSKAQLRARCLAARRAMTAEQRAAAGAALAAVVLDLPAVSTATSVAAYLSIGTEPPTTDLVRALRARGTGVLAPVLRDDRDLDWAQYDHSGPIAQGPGGTRNPAGTRHGPEEAGRVDALIVPALAVDRTGLRLGRGGGSYDRALARVPSEVPVIALLYDGEVLDAVPAEPHDRPVTLAVTPSRTWSFTQPPR
jgi:5-formyltetrahydrofolate cyclo-ligase